MLPATEGIDLDEGSEASLAVDVPLPESQLNEGLVEAVDVVEDGEVKSFGMS